MPSFIPQSDFTDGVEQILSAGDLGIFRKNVALIDALSYRQTYGFDSSSGGGTPTPGFYPAAPNFRIWKGYFRFRTGMTTLTVKGRTTFPGTVELKVYLNGGGGSVATISSPQTSFTEDITISGLGYADQQIVPIEILATGTGSTKTATCVITDIYASPYVSAGGSYGGVPTFTSSTINQTKLTQLGDAIEWCYDRMAEVPILPQRGTIRQLGPFRNGSEPIWIGSVVRNYSEDILRIFGEVTNPYTPSWNYTVYINQVLAYTSSTFGAGTTSIYLPLDFSSVTVGSAAEVSIYHVVTDQGLSANWKQPRFTLYYAATNPSGNMYPTAALPTAFEQGSLSDTELVSRLNDLCTIVTATKARIDAAPHVWERVRAVRTWYGWDEDTRGVLPQRAPLHFNRRGSRLVVRGKDVKIGWGAPSTPVHQDGFIDYDNYEFPHTEQVIDADKIDTKEVYLDSYPGLYLARQYYLIGDVYYAEEYLD